MKKHMDTVIPLAIGLFLQFVVLAIILMSDPQTLATHSNPIGTPGAEVLSQTLQSASTLGMNK
ncbi:MAG: hypothetical protein Q4A84_08050 [Neisseria sp.]|uniref:hypothetical protein n=1 Tax=Neisseria sp. TaxID=192066 RepID=UPI0026DCB3F7|nr:hypothetical protein [Neisseria sp.]MDO4641633.1 hypothetical protein [Neisseria sp.]